MFATPWVALGYELTPDYHERTRLMAVQNAMGYVAYLIAPWFVWFMNLDMFDDMVHGAGWLAFIIGLFTICVGIFAGVIIERAICGAANTYLCPQIQSNQKEAR